MQVCVSMGVCPPQRRCHAHRACGAGVFMGLWINHECVLLCQRVYMRVCVFRGVAGVCPVCTPTQSPHAWPPAPGLESMRITRVTMEIHKHKYALGQQRTHTRRHAGAQTHNWTALQIIAFSIFDIFILLRVMTQRG